MGTVGRVPRSEPAVVPRSGPAEVPRRGPAAEAPFHSIESAQEFLALLGETIDEALDEVQQELAACTMRQQQRQVDAWRIVLFTTTKLGTNIAASRRLLNDLRMLRNLLHRNIPASASPPHPAPSSRPAT